MLMCKKCNSKLPDEAIYCMFCGKKLITTAHSTKQRGNGQGTVYKLPNGKYVAEVTLYWYIGSDGKKKRKKCTKYFDKKKDAIAALPELKKSETIKPTSLAELHKVFLQSKKYATLSNSQKDKLRYAWNRLQKIHTMDIAKLTIDDMQKTIDEQVQTFYPAKDMKTVLSHCFTLAIQRELVQYNKTQYLELPPLKKSQRDAFHADEIEKLWAAWKSNKTFAGYILIMIYAGLRYGEIATIQKSNIHLSEHYAIGGIKTEAGIDREIAFADKIMPVVEYFYNLTGSELLMDIPEQKFYDNYHSLTSELGIRDLPPHCCRHTYFTRLATEHVQAAVITEAGGHKDLSVTMSYIHIPLAEKLAAVNKI